MKEGSSVFENLLFVNESDGKETKDVSGTIDNPIAQENVADNESESELNVPIDDEISVGSKGVNRTQADPFPTQQAR